MVDNEKNLNYNTTDEYYKSFDCEIIISKEEFKSYNKINDLFYFCPKDHLICNLTIDQFKFCIENKYGCCDMCKKVIINRKCKHNVRDYNCRKCPGPGICKHDRQRSTCKECKGSQICEHDRVKSSCKDCDGKQICDHNKVRSTCKDCKGGSICEYNKEKRKCKECKGSSICEHNIQKYQCKKCKGSSICEHNRVKSSCKECKGGHICEHNERRSICKVCKGGHICNHNKLKSECKDCKGSQICEHFKLKNSCRICIGSQICCHDKRRNNCIVCRPEKACLNCKNMYVTKKSRFYPHCFRCYCILNPNIEIPRRYKLKEHHFTDRLKVIFGDKVTMTFDKQIEGGCSKKRPDVFIHMGEYSIVLECDEDQHKKDYTCENKRMMELFQDNNSIPLVMIRFNPDSYTMNEEKIDGCFTFTKQGSVSVKKKEWNRRISILKKRIDFYIINRPEKEITYEELFYDT
jgi:hypothetical protein